MNVIAGLIGQMIQVLYYLTGDYGIAIVVITLIIKLLLLPFSIRQRKQMGKQKEMNEKVAEIQKRYANNKNKMNEELQKVYAENGLASMGYCQLQHLYYKCYRCYFHIFCVSKGKSSRKRR